MNKENKALELFGYGYEDSVIAARTGLSEEDVRDLRKAWGEVGQIMNKPSILLQLDELETVFGSFVEKQQPF